MKNFFINNKDYIFIGFLVFIALMIVQIVQVIDEMNYRTYLTDLKVAHLGKNFCDEFHNKKRVETAEEKISENN